MGIEIKDLTKLYGPQAAVDHVSFMVSTGEIVGFLGPNGAGKSTTMKIATCYLPPSSGTVLVNGHDVLEEPKEVRRQVGYLPEHNPLYLDMYVREYLHFVGKLHGLGSSQVKARTEEMINLCGLTRERHKKIGALSKGYRQRVGLAQALIHDPQVLILDEPTTGLDPNQIVEIRQLIKEVGQQKTVLFSTHIMQEVSALCDRVLIINKGKLVADSPVAELRNMGRKETRILAEFEAEVDTQPLLALPGVTRVEPAGALKYRIIAASNSDLRSAIFRLAGDRGWPLVGLQQEENSLEKLFQELTKSGK
ncbi:gliding motility-associated ABC transporter ATP-binding subunit GldA [Rufibacter glacialis]|uniref:Gliding motility-associated ABC transporter ATP-binding subunit GldA n=1 Tax=Rufibacter glacialis TaxID=1259555 RepID=A0A5M8Q972_9BACT|nr:gliding motility-associated ABC transporter ATP-binding subunit GldA [Rufibacter glacialis]KAA6431713.1 gliding motility-associated ABC transporter ATP-binding subunit GldA [Rufibacter glacialis]GGK82217.1 multidrug ABC transporter ATP-binding protein [Rufibacter glacialis]